MSSSRVYSDLKPSKNKTRPATISSCATQCAKPLLGIPPKTNIIQTLIDNSPQVRRIANYQQIANQSLPKSEVTNSPVTPYQFTNLNGSPAQLRNMRGCVTESKQEAVSTGIQKIIHSARGAKDIADDLAVFTDKKYDGDSIDKAGVKAACKKIGYSNAYATRISENNPFTTEDLDDMSNHEKNGYKVDSFEHSEGLQGESMRHQLHFSNTYNPYKPWQMHYNARNPVLSTFRAADVTNKQAEIALEDELDQGAEVGDHMTSIRRENVVSKTGEKWRSDNNPPLDAELSANHLASFLLTENGASSVKIADQFDKEVESGKIEKYGATGFSVLLRLKDQ